MPMVKHRTFLFEYMGFEGAIVFGEPFKDRYQPGCELQIYTVKDSSDPVTKDNFKEQFETSWGVWLSSKELIELGHYMIKMGILSTEADGEANEDS